MLIILEGPDGAGKTTLARAIIKQLHDEYPATSVRLYHRGPPRVSAVGEYEHALLSYRPDGTTHRVCDRWHLGELVYPDLLGRRGVLDEPTAWHVELTLRARGALLVYVRTDESRLITRLSSRGDALVRPDQAGELLDRYDAVVSASELPTMLVDTSDHQVKLIARQVVERARRYELQAVKLSAFITYLGPPTPQLLLLGDVRNVPEPRTSPWPAFVPVNTNSGHFLLSALLDALARHAWYGSLGLANACDVDDPIALMEALDYPEVITLGRNAARRVTELGIANRMVYHPQYVKRFFHGQRVEYGQWITDAKEPLWS